MGKIVHLTKVIKSKTNNNELCKQYFAIYGTNNDDICLIIDKVVLSSDFDLYKDYKLIRKFNNKGLFFINYSIRLETLMTINEWLVNLLK